MMMAWHFRRHGCRIEAQAISVEWRGARWPERHRGRCEVRCGDFRDRRCCPRGAFDLVTGTPPICRSGRHRVTAHQWGPCHFEHAADRGLLHGSGAPPPAHGRFVMSAGGTQQARVADAAAATDLSIVRQLDVVPRRQATLFRVYVFDRGASAGAARAAARRPRCARPAHCRLRCSPRRHGHAALNGGAGCRGLGVGESGSARP